MDDLASQILASSQRLGIDPADLATAISYETGGTFDPWQAGPTTKWGQHRGLIQMGEPQRAEYGYAQGAPLDQQMRAVEKYLVKAGVRPGMGLLDVYSAINAGGVGRYGRSDAAAGGAPGTVRDKVETQMGGHRQNAMGLLNGGSSVPSGAPAGANSAGVSPIAAMFTSPELSTQPAIPVYNRQRQEEAAAAEQARRAALFGGPVASLFG